jgi:DNA-binding transcriptional MerR regulator
MASQFLRTTDLAKAVGVHVNTIRLYEEWGLLPKISRGANGYRQYTTLHLEQARLARLALEWPFVGARTLLVELVKSAASGDFAMAMEQAYQYLARVRMEITYAEAAIDYLEQWAAGHIIESSQQKMNIGQAASYLNITVDMLRNWERNGLITIPRDPANGYRLYGTTELGRLRVIRTLNEAGYSQMAILRMLLEFDAGRTHNLRAALEIPREESMNEAIEVIADRRLSSLIQLEKRAKDIIQQIRYLVQLSFSA